MEGVLDLRDHTCVLPNTKKKCTNKQTILYFRNICLGIILVCNAWLKIFKNIFKKKSKHLSGTVRQQNDNRIFILSTPIQSQFIDQMRKLQIYKELSEEPKCQIVAHLVASPGAFCKFSPSHCQKLSKEFIVYFINIYTANYFPQHQHNI